jgi:hypothetical protein
MSEQKKCKCGKVATQLTAGMYRSDDSTVFVFNDADNRGLFLLELRARKKP